MRLALFEHPARGGSGIDIRDRLDITGAPPAKRLADFLAGRPRPDAVAHRVVHGGERLVRPVRVDAPIRTEIERLVELAPQHNPQALAWMRACDELLGPTVSQVAVFDTAFYAELPGVARTYALPRELVAAQGLRRYGFHGLAHRALWQRWQALQPQPGGRGRVISLQLGGGCSITAVANGRPLDTSMGFSPLEGLVMATRCGDLDLGVVLALLRGGATPAELETLLNERCGLLGVSGSSGDMRALLASAEPAARLAVDLYCYRARKYIGAYLAVLGGADAILFGGGVGENAPAVRAQILNGLEWAGIAVDAARNAAARGSEGCISPDGSPITAWVIPVDEARVLADEAVTVLQTTGGV